MTLDDFLDGLDVDLSWRKKEISDLLSIIQNNNTIVLRKSLLLILYSHWEGFIKNSSKTYLFHIEKRNLKLDSLTTNYKAIQLKGIIGECFKSEQGLTLNKELDFMAKFDQKEGQKFSLGKRILDEKNKSIINTKDNLNPDVFFNLCKVIGLPEKKSISTRDNWINDHLLNNRNSISHGSKLELPSSSEFDLSLESITELKNVIVDILSNFKEDLAEYATNELFLLANSDKKNVYDLGSDKELAERINI